MAQAVRHAKETWIEDVATQAEQARPNDSARWDAIRKLQTLHHCRCPVQPSVVYLEDGTLTDGPDSVCSRWFRHFRGVGWVGGWVLNVESVFEPDVLNSMEGRLPYDELDEPPTLTELKKALKSMKPGKAGGQSTILPDMILHGGSVLHHCMQ